MKGSLGRHLARHHDALRRALVARHSLRAFAIAAVAIAIAVLAGVAFPAGPGAATLRLALFALATSAAALGAARAVVRANPGFERFLEDVETAFPAVRSWLRNALDLERTPPAHTSAELAAALSDETVRRLDGVAIESLRPRVAPLRPLATAGIAFAALLVAAAVLPQRTERAWRSLWNPALAAPPVRLVVEPGNVTISPGASLSVRARVWGSDKAPALERERVADLAAVAEGAGTRGERVWRFDLGSLTREQAYRVRALTTRSPRYTIALAGEPRALSFDVETRSPAYARLPVQRTSATRGDLAALRGAQAVVEVMFDRDLTALEAQLPGGARATTEAVSARRWRVAVPIARDGRWTLRATAASGSATLSWPVRALEDAPPVLAVRTPEGDLDLPEGQLVPLEVLGQDDLGLSTLELEVKKGDGAWHRAPLANFPGAPRDAQVASRWDASGLGLLPGESATFRFALYDNNAFGRGRATSPEFTLRFPSLADLYDAIDREHSQVQTTIESLADKARELQKSLDKLQRQAAPNRAQPSNASSFERREELKTSLERQQDLSQKLGEAAKDLKESLEKAAERRAYDQELMRKLDELSKLMKEIESPELKQAMERMKQALERMDREAMDRNLQQWREENKDLLKNLERTLELMKELRNEEKLAALGQKAEELEKRQNALNDRHGDRAEHPDPNSQSNADEASKRAEEQAKAADESRKLAEETKQLASEMQNSAEQQQLDEAAEELGEQAAQQQQEASESAERQQNRAAQQQGQKASQSLSRAKQSLQSMLQQRQQSQGGENLAAVRRAAQDLVSLQRAVSGNLQSQGAPSQRADRQLDLAEGTNRVADSLYALAAKTPFISRQLGEALGRAMQNLDRSGRAMSEGNRAGGEEAGRMGADALTQAVLELRNSESQMCQNPGSGQRGQKSGMQSMMGEAGERQSRLNQQTQRIAQRLTQQSQGLTPDDRAELQRLAEEQRAIRERVQQLTAQDEAERRLLGRLDQTQKDMQQAEESLQSGNADGDLEQTQTRILSRLLDAQRSVNRRDFNPERESRSGDDVARSSPAPLPAELFRTNDRLRLALLKAEADRYPAQYRALVERYLRSLNGGGQ